MSPDEDGVADVRGETLGVGEGVDPSCSCPATICVIGLGYVGLPLAQAFVKSQRVIGFDIDTEKVRGFKEANGNQNLIITSEPEDIRHADFVIICVPTPVTRTKEIDLSFVKSAAR